ncbi:hypothetical protein [Marinobacter sp.]|uniref:hypothetical protein n=1 Tax=Marinobacter sp. TaxID=50741 RepID=UPI002B26ED9E|nr:hypothetical protein [Marinobacter sp.]
MALKYRMRALRTDTLNRLRYGASAPRYAERVWIDPGSCSRYIEAADLASKMGTGARQLSGRIVKHWPTDLEQPFDCHPKLSYCWAHWRDGESWEQAGAIEFMMSRIRVSPKGVTDKCRTREDVLHRFEALDDIWNETRSRGELASQGQLNPDNFREVGGILMHLGPGGKPVFSGAGCHRFAIAFLLGRPFPAQIGCIHVSAITKVQSLRRDD